MTHISFCVMGPGYRASYSLEGVFGRGGYSEYMR